MKKILLTGIGLLALLGLLAGCTATGGMTGGPSIDSITAEIAGGTTPPMTTPTGTATMTPTGTATMTPTSTSAMGNSVEISITVSNFQVVDEIGGITGVGDGYFIYYLDTVPGVMTDVPQFTPTPTTTATATPTPTFSPTPTSTPTGMGMAYSSTETSFTWDNLSPGFHVFAVQLVDAMGEPLSPPVMAAAALMVGGTSTMTPTGTATMTPTGTATMTPTGTATVTP